MNTKSALLNALDETDRRTLELVDSLDEEQLAVPYQPGINPPLWELGHAAFFYEFFILRALDGASPVMPGYDVIWDSFEIKHRERWKEGVVPEKAATVDYYRRIIDAVRERMAKRALTPQAHYLYKYAIFHQHMHIESLIWSRQSLGYPRPPGSAPPSLKEGEFPAVCGDADVPGGKYLIGVPRDDLHWATTHFAFDNEKPAFEIEIEPFAISKSLVSNREFLQFVAAEGYSKPQWWSYSGRRWLESSGRRKPFYWKKQADGSWLERLFDTWHPLSLEAPMMHVNFWEAEAYCCWANRRLPTEFEWEIAARGGEGRLYPWGDDPLPDASLVDMDGISLGQGEVAGFGKGASPWGCRQMLGTAWEWTSSQFLPYDGFCVDMYPYMSTLQFGDHKVTRGGSWATSSCLIRNTYRQAYHPDRQDVFTGIRTCGCQ